ncbi:MAG: GNAT family N-acyltransferase, partial [Pseudomonadota bacterium]
KLRHQVFLEEGLNRSHQTGLEFDDFDHRADHLMIIEKENNIAVGTYRLIHSDYSEIFYSQGEFHLDKFLGQEGKKLELGRACTHSEHRTGRTMDLLWQGLSRYIRDTRTRYLFGCSSIDSIEPTMVFSILKSLDKKGNLSDDFTIRPTPKYEFPTPEAFLESAEVNPGVLRALPPLLRSYLHAGSCVYGFPALDKDFACADLFTILDLLKLNKKFAERYDPVRL